MENQDINISHEEMWKKAEKSHRRGKIFGGLLIVAAGSLFLAKELGVAIPQWVFTWKLFLIAIGLMIGVKHNFRHAGWFILVTIGGVFLLGDLYPSMTIKPLLWPILIILVGLAMIFKPRRKHNHHHWHQRFNDKHRGRFRQRFNQNECYTENTSSNEDFIDSTSFMGGVKKNILSKKFRGGDITNVFGGAEINLSQADFEKTATLEMTNVFGGTKLIIPAHWEIDSELVCVLGSIEDKRPVQPNSSTEATKTLILKGTTFIGGIDIRSY